MIDGAEDGAEHTALGRDPQTAIGAPCPVSAAIGSSHLLKVVRVSRNAP